MGLVETACFAGSAAEPLAAQLKSGENMTTARGSAPSLAANTSEFDQSVLGGPAAVQS